MPLGFNFEVSEIAPTNSTIKSEDYDALAQGNASLYIANSLLTIVVLQDMLNDITNANPSTWCPVVRTDIRQYCYVATAILQLNCGDSKLATAANAVL